jgi:transketolase
MRQAFCDALLSRAAAPQFVFLTGDLGFKALEPLREAMGQRFINAGVAEQNMVSVAAGLARSGLRPWTYSIAPFLYARPFEQIRNDICLHDLPVILVGNGGGYGYGVMGSSHHALEDYGALLTLPHMRAFVPAFDEDLAAIVPLLMECAGPAYLRLGLSEAPRGMEIPPYAPWRKLLDGNGPVMACVGPLIGGLLEGCAALPTQLRPELWLVSELPLQEIPDAFLDGLRRIRSLVVVEEHSAHGGFGQMLTYLLTCIGQQLDKFSHRHAVGYVSGLYGSQRFHRKECGLDPASILEALTSQ